MLHACHDFNYRRLYGKLYREMHTKSNAAQVGKEAGITFFNSYYN
jgi:hypothetical protein